MFRRLKVNPILGIVAAFALTVAAARVFSLVLPRVHWEPVPGMHIHHYVYGIFILTVAGYLALIFKGSRATIWIGLLYGLGVGLTFDEFGMWMNPPFIRGVRWNTSGLTIVALALGLLALLPVLLRRRLFTGKEAAAPLLNDQASETIKA
jgi:hypothetical protein